MQKHNERAVPTAWAAHKRALEAERTGLLKLLKQEIEDSAAVYEDKVQEGVFSSHPADLGGALQEELELEATTGHQQAELLRIQAALERMAAGSYGTCLECGQPIPEARLNAQPTAEHHIPCQEAFEKRGGRPAAARP